MSLIFVSKFILLSQDNKLINHTSKLDLILLDPVSDINKLVFKNYEDKLYLTSNIIKEDSIAFYDFIEIDKYKKVNHYKVVIPKNLIPYGEITYIRLGDFCIYNEKLFLNFYLEVAVFQLDENKQYNYMTSIPKDKEFEKMKIIDNKIYGYSSVFDETKDSTLTFLWIYDINTNSAQTQYYEDPKGIEWTQIRPRKRNRFI